MAGITKWFWVTIEGYINYLLPKFVDFVNSSLVLEQYKPVEKCVIVTADYCIDNLKTIYREYVDNMLRWELYL